MRPTPPIPQGPDKADLFLYALESLPQQNYPYQVACPCACVSECVQRMNERALPAFSVYHARVRSPLADRIHPGMACQLHLFSAGDRHAWSVLRTAFKLTFSRRRQCQNPKAKGDKIPTECAISTKLFSMSPDSSHPFA